MIKRKATAAYTDEPVEDTRAICNNCLEDNVTVKLELYEPDPTHYKQCPRCKSVVDIYRIRHISETGPLGTSGNTASAEFEVISKRRGRSLQREADFEIPKLGNKEDIELKQMVADGAVIVAVNDDNVDGEE